MTRRFLGVFVVAFWMIAPGTFGGCSGSSGLQSPATAAPHQKRFSIQEIQSLGGSLSSGGGISDNGVVSGFAATTGDAKIRALNWKGGSIDVLPTLGGPVSFAWTISANGHTTGFSETKSRDPNGEDFNGLGDHLIELPAFWSDERLYRLPLLAGGNNGNAEGINAVGQVAGLSETGAHDPTCTKPQVLAIKPLVWKDGKVQTVLPTWKGDSMGIVTSMNDAGDATGATGFCGTGAAMVPFNMRHAVLWRKGRIIDLGNLGGSVGQEPLAINNRGQIAGQSSLSGTKTYHAFLWDGKMHDLGALPGDCCSIAEYISDDGTVSGTSCTYPSGRLGVHAGAAPAFSKSCRGVLWKDGTIVDVNSLLLPSAAMFVTTVEAGPNALGQIAGDAIVKGTGAHRGFVGVPMP